VRTEDSFFCAGVITAAHGLHGHVKVKCFLENPQTFKSSSPFCNERGEPLYKVIKVLSQAHDILTISLEGIQDRTQAEALKGTLLMAPRDRLKPLTDDTFYHQDLMGLAVQSSDGEPLGHVHALHNFGAGDIIEIKTQEGSLVMLPFTHDIVPLIRIEEGFVTLSDAGEQMIHDA